jgi:hypothetical protein
MVLVIKSGTPMSAKIFVMIMFGLSWFLANFFISNKFGMRSGYAEINDVNFSQPSFKNLEEKTPSYQLALSNNAEGNASKKKIIKIFGTKEPVSQNLSPKEIERRINSFDSYLNQQQYVKSYKHFTGTKEEFQQILRMLARKPPVVPRETDSINDVLKNVFHFYRVLGKERISLIKDIIENNIDIIEPLMHTFYFWFTSHDEYYKSELTRPSFEKLYIYACFFLETLGGRSYVFRRDSKVRILTLYYCVLIIDQANIDEVNSYGIDIRPHLKFISEDMIHQKDLNYENQYFMKLEMLRKKYRLP